MRLHFLFLLLEALVLIVILHSLWRPRQTKRHLQEIIELTRQRFQRRRLPKPKSPKDCHLCRSGQPGHHAHHVQPIPYAQLKSKRGRPKQSRTHGFACQNPHCAYFLNFDATVHALVADRNRDGTQYWLCQACGRSFSQHKGTPLYHLKSSAFIVGVALQLLCLGLSRAAIARVLQRHPATVAHWLDRAGHCAQQRHDVFFKDLELQQLQLDELQIRMRTRPYRRWGWFAIDPVTKIIPAFQVGSRKRATAMAFIHDLAHRLKPDHLPIFTSDGLLQYFHALTAHFGHWIVAKRSLKWQVDDRLQYAQIIKITRYRKLLTTFPRALAGKLKHIQRALREQGFSGIIQTAIIERFNLTLRHALAPLARRSWGTYWRHDRMTAHLELFRSYYHFCRPHRSLKQGRRDITPAMAAQLTDHVWSMHEWLTTPVYVT